MIIGTELVKRGSGEVWFRLGRRSNGDWQFRCLKSDAEWDGHGALTPAELRGIEAGKYGTWLVRVPGWRIFYNSL